MEDSVEEVDLVIVGAGPHALTLLARLVEEEPADLYDRELRHYNRKRFGSGKRQREEILSRIVVIDPSGAWLSDWNENFEQLEIDHLRSPVSVHPDPQDTMALREFAELRQRERMLKSGEGCGRTATKKRGQTASTATLADKQNQFSDLVHIDLLDKKQGWLDKQARKKRSQMAIFSEAQRELLLLPSSELFSDFVASVVSRYQIEDKVTKGKVVAIDPHTISGADEGDGTKVDYFDVRWCQSGCSADSEIRKLRAKSVVVAIGGGNMARVPDWVTSISAGTDAAGSYPVNTILHSHQLTKLHRQFQSKQDEKDGPEQNPRELCTDTAATTCQSQCMVPAAAASPSCVSSFVSFNHSFAAPPPPAPAGNQDPLQEPCTLRNFFCGQRVLVVGGGLSAGHIALLGLRKHGSKSVISVARRKRMIKQFDAELCWVSRTALSDLNKFWSERDPEKRLCMVKQARGGGGTVTPQVETELNKLVKTGRYKRVEGVEVVDAKWVVSSADGGGCSGGGGSSSGCWQVSLCSGEQVHVDRIVLATGSLLDVYKEPLFKDILQKLPIPTVSGFPVLGSDDMAGSCQWGPDKYGESCRLYVMGGYATLSLGPMSGNLVGAVTGARQVASSLGDFIGHSAGKGTGSQQEQYYSKVGSMYAVFGSEDESSSSSSDDDSDKDSR